MERRTVFKVYGKFDWPGSGAGNTFQVPGKFLFYYADYKYHDVHGEEQVDNQAAVEWIPDGHEGKVDPRRPSQALDQLSSTELNNLKVGKPFNYWLRGKFENGKGIEITGVQVFEQIAQNPNLSLRLLLATRFKYGNAEGSSAVYFGQSTGGDATYQKQTFGFRLALPTPTPHGKIDAKFVYVFPFRVRYDSVAKEKDDLHQLNVAELAAGYDGTASDCPFINQRLDKNEARLRSHALDKECTILGQFGFSKAKKSGGHSYAYFPRGNESADALWLIDRKKYFRTTLSLFSDLDSRLQKNFRISSEQVREHLSGEFYDSVFPTGNDTQSRVYFRSSFCMRPGNLNINEGDIQREGKSDNKDGYLRYASPLQVDGRTDLILDRANNSPPGAQEYKWVALDQVVSVEISDKNRERYFDDGLLKGSIERTLPFFPTESDDAIKATSLLGPLPTKKKVLKVGDIFQRALCSFRFHRIAIASNEASDSGHAIPDAYIENLHKVRFALHGNVDFLYEGYHKIIEEKVSLDRKRWSRFPFNLVVYRPEKRRHLEDAEDETAGHFCFSLPGLEIPEGRMPAQTFRTQINAPEIYELSGAVEVSLNALSDQKPTNFAARLGGLQLGTVNLPTAKFVSGAWNFRPFIYVEGPVTGGRQTKFAADDTTFEITLGIDRVEPIGVDRPRQRRDTREAPLLLPIGNQNSSEEGGAEESLFRVTLREEIRRDTDRHFTAHINDTDAHSEKQRPYVVLSRQPFSVTALTIEPLQSRGDEGDSKVATYDGDTRTWLFSTVDRRFHYRLPPQGIGESMDKPGWLEILDAKFEVELDDEEESENRQPFVQVPVKDDDTSKPLPALRRRVVDYRLTAPAHLWIEPSDLERNFVVPEWAIYELFRQRGDFGVGARLAGLRAEWVYGLAASIDPAKESGAARGARVAEIEMLLGQVPTAEKEGSNLSKAAQRWNRLHHLIAHRPERLEMWMPNPGLNRAFEPARFAEGVRFTLRDNAQFRYPFPLRDTDGRREGEKVVEQLEENYQPDLNRHGLAGGAIWGLESSAFVREFLKRPESTGGTIERIALSPHGGDANFRAEFLNGLLAITAEVRSGRVQRQRVEIIGRIGVFWNRAKHVVIYERTTSPSAQFTPVGGLRCRTRRPVIRKVEEFVEMLQPARSFPDTPNADPISVGFLKATNFNSKVIHVDSAWSEDVGKDGWKIPLWNRLSAKQRPSVYPQPNIAFIVHSEGEESEPVTAQECLDPENLFFYSDATAATSDTDQWGPVISVDWTNLPPPRHSHQQSVDERASNQHPRKPSAQRFPRGQRRFTWRLAPSARRAKLNHGREGKPIYAALDTLTFSRATADVNSAEVKQFDEAMRSVSKALAPDNFAPVEKAMASFRRAAERGDKDTTLASAKKLQLELENARKYKDLLNNDASRHFDEIVRNAQKSPQKCRKMVDDFVGGIQRKRLLFLANLNEWKADVDAFVAGLGKPQTREELIGQALLQVRKAITPGLEGTRGDLGNARSQVQQARAIVSDMAADARARIVRANAELEEAYRAYDDHKPWSAARLEECQRQLESARAGLISDIEAALSDARQRLATETHGLTQKLGRATAAAMDAAARAEDGVLTRLGTAETAALAVVNDAQERVQQTVGILLTAFDKAEKAAAGITDEELKNIVTKKLADARKAIVLANREFADICSTVRRDASAGRKGLESVVAQTHAACEHLEQVIADGINALEQSITLLDAHQAVKDVIVASKAVSARISAELAMTFKDFQAWARGYDRYLARIRAKLADALEGIEVLVKFGTVAIDTQFSEIVAEVDKLNDELATDKVLGHLETAIIRPAFNRVVPVKDYQTWLKEADRVSASLEEFVREVDGQLQSVDGALAREFAFLQESAREVCGKLQAGIDLIKKTLDEAAGDIEGKLAEFAGKFDTQQFKDAVEDFEELHKWIDKFSSDFDGLRQQASDVRTQYDAYADRVFEESGNIGKGGLAAAPNNLLRLWAAAASAPEMPNLDYNRERLGYYYRELNNVIDTTPAEAFFARLGSELKAMGITLPFEQFDRKMVMLDPSKYDIGSVLNRFCGMDWSKLFKGSKLPASTRDAIRLTHDLDNKNFRAWAQVDINLPMPSRRSLFTVGPFKLDFLDMQLIGQVRLEASKDTDRVAQSGYARLVTTIDAVVSGQSMVQLRKVVLEFDKHGKLDVQIDPKNIKINPALEFVQEALAGLFPDEVGGMQVVKKNGLPIGVEHVYSMPPISIMGGTSGISNLAISNRFALLAYPDFVIANRFALSRPDMPFLFTIFVIGGSGYILVDAEYRPFNDELAVTVEAAAGGSAALGFSLGPVSGSVYVSLSVALSYRKVIGRRGGGLTVSVLLVIAGNVDVAGLARVNITLILRMYYRSNSQIDGLGTLSVSFRVTRWYKYRFRKNYQKTLRKGRSKSSQNYGPLSVASARMQSNAAQMMEARQ